MAEQVAGKDRRLVAAGAGADLEEDVAVVALVLRDQQPRQVEGLRLEPCVQLAQTRPPPARASPHRRLRPFPRRSALGLQAPELAEAPGDWLEARILHRQVAKRLCLPITSGSDSKAPTSSNRSTVVSRRRRMESFISRR